MEIQNGIANALLGKDFKIGYIHYHIGIDCGFWFILYYLLEISF